MSVLTNAMTRILSFLLCFCFFSIINSHACTLWGCIGETVKNGGLLISKNRDRKEVSITRIKLYTPENSFKYLAMYGDGNPGGVKGGINECGLVVFTASASCLKKENRVSDGKNKIRHILSSCKSVDEVLKDAERLFSGKTQFMLIGDNKELAYIEVTPENKIYIKRISNGTLAHTNHYLHEEFTHFNQNKGESSNTRLKRIEQLLASHRKFTLKRFISMSEDRHDGPDNSIWRLGSNPDKVRTLANMSIYVPIKGIPQVYIKMKNKEEPEKTVIYMLNKQFWEQKEGFLEIDN